MGKEQTKRTQLNAIYHNFLPIIPHQCSIVLHSTDNTNHFNLVLIQKKGRVKNSK